MWPMLLDMTEEESVQSLRHLELEAYSSLVSALRAQGSLSTDKKRILMETSLLLNISTDRHKAEIRRAISDEKLNTIAYHLTGQLNSLEEWALEGRRLVPLLPRVPPQTPYSVIADEASESASLYNKQLPLPFNTERKRPLPQTVIPSSQVAETNGKSAFRVPDTPKEEHKRRKCHSVGETSSLAQHLLGPKLTKIQQIYRQASKPKLKPVREPEPENKDLTKLRPNGAQLPHPIPQNLLTQTTTSNQSKINIIQNITLPPTKPELPPKEFEKPIKEMQATVTKPLTLKQNDTEVAKKTISIGQKVIVVSNSQTIPTNSILQKTLSVPMNKLTKLNLDNFKIIPNSQLPPTSGLQLPNRNSPKPKLVTIKGTSNKKLISLSKLQMLNSNANLKMVPYEGSFPNNSSIKRSENLDELVALETNGVVGNGEKDQIVDNFRLTTNSNYSELELGCTETLSSESSETDDRNSNDGSSAESMELENCDFLETQHDGEVLQEFEVIHTDEVIQ